MSSCLATQHLVVVDPAVSNYEILLDRVLPEAEVAVLTPDQNGVAQITELLKGRTGKLALHVICHGEPGFLHLGNSCLSGATLPLYQAQLQAWFGPGAEASLLLYGCRVAAGRMGAQFVRELHRLTGAALAASPTLTGQADLGGDWCLDFQIAQPTLALPFAPAALRAFPGVLTQAPTITNTITTLRTTLEDTPLVISGLSVADPDGEAQTVTLTTTNGTLNLGTAAGLINLTGGGTNALSFSGSLADINTALASLTFSPTGNYAGPATLTLTVNDGDQTATQTLNLSVTAVNDVPTLAPSAATVNEGGTVTFGNSNLGLADGDNQPVQLIIKIHSLPGKGLLTHGGAPVVVGSTFSSDQIGQLVYHHDGTQTTVLNGTSDSFQVTVEDGAGGLVAATTLPITIALINQPPTVTGKNTVFEGEQDHPVTVTISDLDQTQPFSLEILSLPSDGVLKVSGTVVTPGQVLSPTELALLTYSHDGNDDNGGFPPDDSFTVRVIDDGGGTGTAATVTATLTLDIIPDNDDPTLAQNTGATLDGVRQIQLTSAMLQVADPDSSNQQLTYTLTALPTQGLVLYNDNGTLRRMVVGTAFTQSELNSGKISYYFLNSADSTGVSDSFQFTVRDGELRVWPNLREGGIYADGGQNTPLSTLSFGLTIKNLSGSGGGANSFPEKGVSLPPSVDINEGANLVNTGGQLNEGAAITIDATKLTVVDSDSPPDQIVFRLMSVPGGGNLFLNGNLLTAYQSFTQEDINQGRLTFVHTGEEVFTDNFSFTLSDGSNVVSNGGLPFVFAIDVTPQNDAPELAVKGTPFGVEGGSILLSAADIGLSDVDGTGDKSGIGFAAPNSLTFKVLDLPDYGVLEVDQGSGFGPVTLATVITKAQLDSGKLRYVHDGSENFADSFQILANDNTGTGNALSQPQTVNLSIAKLNDDPAFSSALDLKVAEGEKGTIKGAMHAPGEGHLVYSDPDNTTLQRQYRITQKVAHGKLLRAGVVLGVGSVFTQQDLDNGLIEYQHDDSENFSDLFKFEVRDGGGGVVPGSYAITIDPPVNDAPTLTVPVAIQTMATVAPFVFSTANGNAITFADPDLVAVEGSEVDVLRVTLDLQEAGLTTLEGTLSLGATAGLVFLNGTADGQSKLTFEGTQQAVAAALEGLQVNIANDLDKTLALVVTLDDRNNGGRDPIPLPAGYSTVVTKTIQLNASNNNDAPTLTTPATAAVNEDVTLAFNGVAAGLISIGDADDFGATMTVTVAVDPGKGSLSAPGASGNGTTSLTLTGSKTAINAALASLTYVPTADYNGPATLTVTVNDGGNTGPGPAKTATQTVNITVAPLNDQPTLQVPLATQVMASGSPLTFTPGEIALGDAPDLAQGATDFFTVTVVATRASNGDPFGTLSATASGTTVSPGGSSITITGTRAAVNATLDSLSYTPANANIDDSILLTVTVDDGNNGAEGTGSVGESTTVTRVITVHVSSTNEAPVVTAPSLSLSVNEDASLTLTGAGKVFSFTDADDFGASNLQATITATKGALSLAAADGTTVSGSGTSTLTLTGTKAQINSALDGLIFTPTANYHGPASLTVQLNDKGNTGSGGDQLDSETVAITVNPINDRPTASGSVGLGAIAEDTTSPASTLLSTLLSPRYSDATDTQTPTGGNDTATPLSYVAIVGSTNYVAGQGSWQVSDGVGGWIAIPTSGLSATAALIFPANREIRFVPAADFHGTPGSLTVRLADGSGTASTNISSHSSNTLSLSSNGGTGTTGAWSSGSVTVSISGGITAVNDAPTIVNPGTAAVLPGLNEDPASPGGATVLSLFGGKYSDTTDNQSGITGGGNSTTGFAGIAVIGNGANSITEGTWQYDTGSGWVDIATAGLGDTAALVLPAGASLRFVPIADYNGTPGSLSVRFADGTSLSAGSGVDISAAVGTPGRWSATSTALATTISPINDAPELQGNGVTPTFVENGVGVAVGSGLTGITDVEIGRSEVADLVTATVTLTDFLAGDQLTFTPGSTGITVTNQGNGVYSLSGGSLANLQAVLQSAVYSSTSENPTNYGQQPSRTLIFQVNDGQASNNLSNTVTSTVTVQAINDPPGVVTSNGATTFTEGNNAASTPVTVDPAVTVSDVDSLTLASAVVAITGNFQAAEDHLAFTNTNATLYGNVTASYNPTTGELTLTSAGATATLAQWQAVLRAVTYTNTSDTPVGTSRMVAFTVNDGQLDSTLATKTLVVNPVNDTPIAVNDSNSVVEDAIAPASGSVLPNDSDLDNPASLVVAQVQRGGTTLTDPNQDLNGSYGSLNWNSDGTYAYTLNNAHPAVQALDENETLTDTFTYTLSDGQGGTATALLTITINGQNDAPTATPIGNQGSVDKGLVSLALASHFSDPDTTDSLSFSATGLPAGLSIHPTTGVISGTIDRSASQGGLSSNGVYTVAVTATDDSGATVTRSFSWTVTNPDPTATNNVGAVSEDGTLIYSGNLLTDNDSSGLDSDPDGDPLQVASLGQGGTLVTDPSQPLVGSYGTLTWGSNGSYTYTLNNAHPAVQALDEKGTLLDVFTYSLSDGEGGTDTASLTITVNGKNDAPVLDLDSVTLGSDYGALYAPAVGSVAIAPPTAQITDVDDTHLVSASLTLTTRPNGADDQLVLSGTLPPGITAGAYNPATGQLLLTGSAPLSAYQAALAAIHYQNSAPFPNRQDRVVQVVVNDGLADSNLATVTLQWDSDHDGVSDNSDWDDDNDGILDRDEDANLDGDHNPQTNPTDTDGDGVPDAVDLDADNDGIPDLIEAGHGETDANGDGRVDGPVGTNGLPDRVETAPDSGIPRYNLRDTDGDGVPDFQDLDSDDDSLADGIEAGGTDADGDALIDGFTDTDGDGLADRVDGTTGGTPLPLSNTDQDSLPDYRDLDSDNDGFTDLREGGNPQATDANQDGRVDGSDADRDGLRDAIDGNDLAFGSSGVPLPAPQDSNGDSTPDYRQASSSNNSGGTSGDDIVTGVDPKGGISGLSDPDAFYGYGGNDIINGGSDVDVIDGGTGNDILNGGSGPDVMVGDAGDDVLSGGSGNDFLDGGSGNDVLMGSSGEDWLIGGEGDDTLNGGRDNDVLIGGSGADTLIGGQGADVFKYQSLGDGVDTIADFEIVSDRIDLSALFNGTGSFSSSVQLQQVGADTLVLAKLGGLAQPLAWLQNVNAVTLGAQHFIFTPLYPAPPQTDTTGPTSHTLPLGQADDYLASNPDLISVFGYNLGAAQQHYAQSGWREGRPIDTFAEDIYLASHGDLIQAFGYNLEGATRHYIEFGYREGRQTNGFNPRSYLDAYGDLKAAFGNDLTAATRHYIEYGYAEGRDPLLGIDGAAYIASYRDLITAYGYNPAAGRQHYQQNGRSEGRTIAFQPDDYLASYGDLIRTLGYDLVAATQHYITLGAKEGRAPDLFDEQAYLNKYADLKALFGNDLQASTQHYIQFGYQEGRTAF